MNAARRITLLVLAIFLTVLSAPARAAEADADDERIPSTTVARLKISKGTVWVRPADSAEWEEYENNFPVAERSRISVPQGSEAELQFRGSQFMLLVAGSEVDVRQLGEQQVSFRLRSGQVALSLPQDGFAPVRVKVPGNRDVRLDLPGRYWLTVDGGATNLLVRAGEGSVTGEGTSPVAVKAGEEAMIGKEIQVSQARSYTPAATDHVAETPLTEAEQQAGVPREAATELRQYGEWVSTPDYGYVWRPYVADGWTPYYYGQWRWVYPYGWSWVGYEPWGWWPYHYGWWVSYPAYGWVWCPYGAFFSASFYWGGYPYYSRNAYYYPANVRYVNNGRSIRWIPERPGHAVPRAAPFSRGDARLSQWNRTLDRGTVMMRGQDGRPVAWEGQGTAGRTGTATRGTVAQRPGSAAGATSARSGGGGSVPGGTGSRAKVASADPGGTRPFAEGGGRVSAARPLKSGVPLRSAATGTTSAGSIGAGGQGRGYGGRGVPYIDAGRGSGYSGSGGRGGGYSGSGGRGSYNMPAPSVNYGPRGSDAAPRGYSPGYDGGSRGGGGVPRGSVGGGSGGWWGGSGGFGGGGRGGGGSFGGGGGRGR